MDQIKQKIQDSINSLDSKRKILEDQRKQYTDLKLKLNDYKETEATDLPTNPTSITTKAGVKIGTSKPKKILVSVGAGYFVERDPFKALEQVDDKLKFFNKTISEFNTQITEAKKTLRNIETLETTESNTISGSSDFDNEESLGVVDIREELDDEGNVISSTVKPQNVNQLKNFGEQKGVTLNPDQDELNDLLKDLEIATPVKKIEEVLEDDIPKNVPKTKTKIIELGDHDVNETKAAHGTSNQASDSTSNEFEELLKDMGILEAGQTSSSSKPLKEDKPSTSTQENLSEVNDFNTKFGSDGPAIDEDDILQLQLIADEIEEEGGYNYSEDEDQDFDDFDEDDDDDDNWDFTSNENNIIPESYRRQFQKELERVRLQSAKEDEFSTSEEVDDDLIPSSIKSSENISNKAPSKSKKSKSVSFAPTLEIKEIENISDQLKEIEDVKLSRFKQGRVANSTSVIKDTSEALLTDENVPAVSQSIQERPISDVFERTNVESTIPQVDNPAKRVSKFKALKEQSKEISKEKSKEEPKSEVPSKAVSDRPISDIVERDEVLNVAPLPTSTHKTSKFKSLQKPTQKKSSRFKSSFQDTTHLTQATPQESQSKIIEIPKTPISLERSDYENVKAYIEDDDDDDEELLNTLTSIEVYTGDVDEEDDLPLEDEDDSGVLLDEIVENDETDDPNYYVDDGLLNQEYQTLRKKMFQKYLKDPNGSTNNIIPVDTDEGQELEPIDEYGNPVAVSRFKKSSFR